MQKFLHPILDFRFYIKDENLILTLLINSAKIRFEIRQMTRL